MLAGAQDVGPSSPEGCGLVLLWQGDWDAAHMPGLLTGPGCLRVVSDPTSSLILTLQILWGFGFGFFGHSFKRPKKLD